MVFGGRGFFLGKTEGVGCRVLPSSGGWWFRNLSHEPLGPMLWGPVLVLSLQSASSTRLGVVNACPGRRTHFSLSCIGEGNGNPLQCSCLENPRDGGVWWAAVYRVAQSQHD